MTNPISNQFGHKAQAGREEAYMKSTIISRISKTIQIAVASAVIAGGVLVAGPLTAGAMPVEDCKFDWNKDHVVNILDILFAVNHYQADENHSQADEHPSTNLIDILDTANAAVNGGKCNQTDLS